LLLPGELREALAIHRVIQKLVNILYDSSKYGPAGCNVNKAIMELRLRHSSGWSAAGDEVFAGPPRAPQTAVRVSEDFNGMEKLRADLDALNFFGSSGPFA